jgi:murein DD-endopeptidase MepM/ murein hydrolase activator NlpD
MKTMKALAAVLALASAGASDIAAAQRVSSNFGYRKDPFHGGSKFHAGMDFAAKEGTPVYATGAGIVRRARVAGGYGNLVEIENGFDYQTRFAHLSKIMVREGQFVRRGELVGLVGSTGRSTGPHLHYEVRIKGKPVQPKDHMQIVFSYQPDWRAVYASVTGSGRINTSAQTAAPARSNPVPSADRPRVTGDIELTFGNGSGSRPVAAGSTTGGFGRVSPR